MQTKKSITSINQIDEVVMKKIRSQEIVMKPRWYFLLGSTLLFIGVVSALVLAAYSMSMMFFSFRHHGPMASFRLQELSALFPWWTVPVSIVSGGVGIWLLRAYEFSYKKNFTLIVVAVCVALIFSALVIDAIGAHEFLSSREPMRRFYKNQPNTQMMHRNSMKW